MARNLRCYPYPVVSIREPLQGPAPAFDGQEWLPNRKEELGVRIVDLDARIAYVVTVEDRGSKPPLLTSRWDATFSGHRLGAEWLSDNELAAVAVSFLRRHARLSAANPLLTAAGFEYGQEVLNPTRERPPLDNVAAEARLAIHGHRGIEDWFGEVYGISPATAKRWIKAAREAGLLPEMTGKPGRPRKTHMERTHREY